MRAHAAEAPEAGDFLRSLSGTLDFGTAPIDERCADGEHGHSEQSQREHEEPFRGAQCFEMVVTEPNTREQFRPIPNN